MPSQRGFIPAEGELRFTGSVWDLGSGKIAEFIYSNQKAPGRFGMTLCMNGAALREIFNAGPVRGALPQSECAAALKAMNLKP